MADSALFLNEGGLSSGQNGGYGVGLPHELSGLASEAIMTSLGSMNSIIASNEQPYWGHKSQISSIKKNQYIH